MAFQVKIKLSPNLTPSVQMKLITNRANRDLKKISDKTVQVLKYQIQTSLQRPGSTLNLSNSIFAEKTGRLSYGVGNIAYLNKNAPYWRWINYGRAASGRTVPPGTLDNPNIRGSFTPGQNRPTVGQNRQGRFQLDGTYFFQPTKPIQPHNFIQRTIQQIPTIIASVVGRR